jgi:hypothetical protein
VPTPTGIRPVRQLACQRRHALPLPRRGLGAPEETHLTSLELIFLIAAATLGAAIVGLIVRVVPVNAPHKGWLTVSFLGLVVAGYVCGQAWLLAGMRCDETCTGDKPPAGADWWQYSEAPQWALQAWLAFGALAAAAVAAYLLLRRRWERAVLAEVMLGGCVGVWAILTHGPL